MTDKVAIVTDSTALIPEPLVTQYGIHVVPQTLIWGEETFKDGIDIQSQEFYARLKDASVMPKTSQPSPAAMHEVFSNLAEGGRAILAILVSEKLSGTIASAKQARELLPETDIEIVDSWSVAMAMGFQVIAAARAAQEGADLQACKALAEKAREHTGVLLSVETLEFLHRGGRIGGAQRLLGTALNLKPILEIQDGRIEPLERVRTRRKALNRLVEVAEERIGGRTPLKVSVIHADAEEEARQVLDRVRDRCDPKESYLAHVSPVVGTHAGPGTVGITYMAGM